MNDPRFDPCEIPYHHSHWPPSKTPQIKMIKEDTIFYFHTFSISMQSKVSYEDFMHYETNLLLSKSRYLKNSYAKQANERRRFVIHGKFRQKIFNFLKFWWHSIKTSIILTKKSKHHTEYIFLFYIKLFCSGVPFLLHWWIMWVCWFG